MKTIMGFFLLNSTIPRPVFVLGSPNWSASYDSYNLGFLKVYAVFAIFGYKFTVTLAQTRSLCNSQKLEFYNVFKDSYTPSTYLDVTRKIPNRKTLVKLRISNHKP